ncbi:Phosphatidyl-N-methylethanolamine N-methyltransferase [Coemansia sp. RSA 1722]|nr:Phosphatidyl-N-methylethanolamine N-methyltransferase [Coemansia sp. RSA 486]KAJ2237620.1 Phosphatidyl-N-methylethanolamine N-methyltransferase [Coemansia sp. RSA 485]KAJ2599931.1 Phosphatidyl-N-methylethanolamine N-methyltransferase [Coemansia sp. RSA 1721]KAJ2601805.1 Phosphatidyl-N-methylethanolamine N-methyltransferase [Coemansia sp. RSA 1722]
MSLVDFSQPSLWISLASIMFNPTFWNIAARQEYHTHWISSIFNNDRRKGCYAIAITIFTLGLVRDALFNAALAEQPSHAALMTPLVRLAAVLLFGTGMLFVLTSTYALGITGTFLGDYFGILMDQRVTSFPFNVLENPMYVGSTMSFIGVSLWHAKPAGLLVAVYVWIVYSVALSYEGPFTTMIYSQRAQKEAATSAKEVQKKKKL